MIVETLICAAFSNTPDRAHRLAGSTMLDGAAVERRVEVRDRNSGDYVISTVSKADGSFDLLCLPVQLLRNPYYVICFDDRDTAYGNALIFDRVYQVDDNGNPPQT